MNNSIGGSNLAAPQHRYRFDFVVKKPLGDNFPYMVPRGYRSSSSRSFADLPGINMFNMVATKCRLNQVVLFSSWDRAIGNYRIEAIYANMIDADNNIFGAWHFADYSRREPHFAPAIRKPSAAAQQGEQQ